MESHWSQKPYVDFPTQPGEKQDVNMSACDAAHSKFDELSGKWLSAYDVGKVYESAALKPSAVSVIPGVKVAEVYDAAVCHGVQPAGIAPAHMRRGKYVHQIPGNPERVYCGPAKLPHQLASKFLL